MAGLDLVGQLDDQISQLASSSVSRTLVRWAAGQLGAYPEECHTVRDLCTSILVARQEGRARDGIAATTAVRLRPLEIGDTPSIYQAAQDPASAYRWRFAAGLPPPSAFYDAICQGVLCQFIVEETASSAPQGLVIAYDYLATQRLCWIAYQRIAPATAGGEMTLGMMKLIAHLYKRWDLDAVYADVPEYNLINVSQVGSWLEEVGRIPKYHWYDGVRWDRVFFRISRADWETQATRWSHVLEDRD